MPLLEGHGLLQMALVFALIGVLGLVLRWTFSRGKGAVTWPEESTSQAPLPTSPAIAAEPWRTEPPATSASEAVAARAPDLPARPDDYGLLASVAAVDTAEGAARVRSLLAEAGIRATTTVGVDGRHRVLVFATELHRARRVAGGA